MAPASVPRAASLRRTRVRQEGTQQALPCRCIHIDSPGGKFHKVPIVEVSDTTGVT
jgi:hypothetical protein